MIQPELILRTQDAQATWREVQKAHPRLLEFADRHYTRQQPGTNQFCRPGKNFTLLLSDGSAGWVTWRPRPDVGRMDNLEAWECTFFRNEGRRKSSELVIEATHLTYCEWGWPPRDGLITSVGIEETKEKRGKWSKPGHCYRKAGWKHLYDKDGKAWFIAPRPVRTKRP